MTLIVVALAFALPRLGSSWSFRLQQAFARLARRQRLAVVTVGLSAFLLRLAVLPLLPVPLPFVPDDFSFLLAADTFAHGRLTNPTPTMWVHFESIHIDMKPTYMSMYFPAEGLVLAAGKILFGHPWIGILITSSLMCAALCWMLQAWLPPTWALLGGFLAVLRLALFGYWANTYHSAGVITALAGALVLGAYPRFKKTGHKRQALLMAVGAGLLALSRPYEGMLLCLPVTAALAYWVWKGPAPFSAGRILRNLAPAVVLLMGVTAWLGYYNYRVFGSPLTLPYTVNRATYAMAPYFVWQSARPEPAYRHEEMRRFYHHNELEQYDAIHSLKGFLPQTLVKLVNAIVFFAGMALLPVLLMVPRALRDRRIRFLALCVPLLMAGVVVEVYFLPYYLAPYTALIYAIGLQAMRHLQFWKPGGQEVGAAIVRFSIAVMIVMAGLRPFDRILHFPVGSYPPSAWYGLWYGPDHFGTERAAVQQELERMPGRQLAVVRYSSRHHPVDEWVYNRANINSSKVIWAREMDAASNHELLQYYKDRHAWLVEPDARPVAVIPYPATERSAAKH